MNNPWFSEIHGEYGHKNTWINGVIRIKSTSIGTCIFSDFSLDFSGVAKLEQVIRKKKDFYCGNADKNYRLHKQGNGKKGKHVLKNERNVLKVQELAHSIVLGDVLHINALTKA